jgi:hypothetical protein
MLVLVSDLNSSAARCSPLPTPGERDELLHGLRRHLGIDAENIRLGRRDVGDRLEITHHIEWHRLVKARIDHERARRHQDRVTVGRRFGDRLRADHAVGAGPVLDHEGLAGLRR